MAAYIGLHHGLLQGAIFAGIAAFVIVVGLVVARWWVVPSENVHIERDEEPDSRVDGDPRDRTSGGGAA
jgi:hypothetical protein